MILKTKMVNYSSLYQDPLNLITGFLEQSLFWEEFLFAVGVLCSASSPPCPLQLIVGGVIVMEHF